MGLLDKITPKSALKGIFTVAVGVATITAIFSVAAVPPVLGAIAVTAAVGFAIYGAVKLKRYLDIHPNETLKGLIKEKLGFAKEKIKEKSVSILQNTKKFMGDSVSKIKNIFTNRNKLEEAKDTSSQTMHLNSKGQTPPPIPPKPKNMTIPTSPPSTPQSGKTGTDNSLN